MQPKATLDLKVLKRTMIVIVALPFVWLLINHGKKADAAHEQREQAARRAQIADAISKREVFWNEISHGELIEHRDHSRRPPPIQEEPLSEGDDHAGLKPLRI